MALASGGRADQDGGSGRAALVISSAPQPPPPTALVAYLRHQVGLSENALDFGLKQAQLEQAPLPVVLWRFGLISLEQLDQVLGWQQSKL